MIYKTYLTYDIQPSPNPNPKAFGLHAYIYEGLRSLRYESPPAPAERALTIVRFLVPNDGARN